MLGALCKNAVAIFDIWLEYIAGKQMMHFSYGSQEW